MADLDQRQLERRAAAGDVEAEARLLLERVRAGELSEEWLRLVALLGHEAAHATQGRPPPLPYDRWCEALDVLMDDELTVRSALALLAVGVDFPGCARGLQGLNRARLDDDLARRGLRGAED